MDLNSVKKGHFASVLPQLLSTHLTSSFNIRWVQIWQHTFPLCNGYHFFFSKLRTKIKFLHIIHEGIGIDGRDWETKIRMICVGQSLLLT